MNTRRKYVVGIGEILWDMLPEGKKIGGAPTNFAYHASQLGIESRVVSAIGNDSLGQEIRECLKEKNINAIFSKVNHPTGTVQVSLDPNGIPSYQIKENTAWDNIPFTNELRCLATETRAVCFGSLAQRDTVSRATINDFLDTMPDGDGQYKIFDVNLRQHFYNESIIRESIKRCNVLKINDEELAVVNKLFGFHNLNANDSCLRLLNDFSLKIVILTCGTNGSYVYTPDEISFIETPQVEVADTVGAGDSFTAAFIASILHGKTIKESHQRAVEISAYVCTQNGAAPKLPQKTTNF